MRAREELLPLTSVRFFAAASIVLLHSVALIGRSTDTSAFELRQGVSLFFILSGFIMVYAYPALPREKILPYWHARLARIWPVHLVVLAAVLFVLPRSALSFSTVTPQLIALQATLTQTWYPTAAHILALNTVTWSLSVEIVFYLLFPILIVLMRRAWWIVIPVSALLVWIVAFSATDRILTVIHDSNAGISISWPPARLLEFVLGMNAAYVWRWLAPRVKMGRAVGTSVECLALALVLGAMYETKTFTAFATLKWHLSQAAVLWISNIGVTCLPFACLFVVLALGLGAVSRLFSLSPLVTLGHASYSLYIVHYPILMWFESPTGKAAFGQLPAAIVFGIYLLTALGGSLLLWRFVEVPGRRLVLGSFERPVRVPAAAARVPKRPARAPQSL
jgi:peptidoglycan/LPS O-acetylase OafA/YrhL